MYVPVVVAWFVFINTGNTCTTLMVLLYGTACIFSALDFRRHVFSVSLFVFAVSSITVVSLKSARNTHHEAHTKHGYGLDFQDISSAPQ